MIVVKIYGGMGNQMFQYALAHRIGKLNNQPIKLELSFFDDPKFQPVYRLQYFNVPQNIVSQQEIQKVRSKKINNRISYFLRKAGIFCAYNKKYDIVEGLRPDFKNFIFTPTKSDIYLEGWFQDMSLLKEVRSDLKDIFIPSEETQGKAKLFKDVLAANDNVVAVHIRKGDMAKNPAFNHLDENYFNRAIAICNEKLKSPHFMFFTDSPEIAFQGIKMPEKHTVVNLVAKQDSYYSRMDDIEDLALLLKCRHFIISNSTFSWWPAFLNGENDSVVVAPAKWYNDSKLQNKFNNSGLLLDDWIKL